MKQLDVEVRTPASAVTLTLTTSQDWLKDL